MAFQLNVPEVQRLQRLTTPEELDEEMEAFRRAIDELHEIPREPTAFEFWAQKLWSPVSQAIVTDLVFPKRFWSKLGLFALTRPWQAKDILSSFGAVLISQFYNGEPGAPDDAKYIRGTDSWLKFTAYVAALSALKVIRLFFRCLISFILLSWNRPMLVFTSGALVFGSISIFRSQKLWMADRYSKFTEWSAPLLSRILNRYFHGRLRVSRLVKWMQQLPAARSIAFAINRIGLFILRQKTFEQLPPFEYPPLELGKRQFRLLRVHRKIPFFDITAELVCHTIDNIAPYTAVSYVWGKDTEKASRIVLNNQQFWVTANVYNILLRRSSIFSSRLMWIDTICIDQGDKSEKGDQVRLMAQIYERAVRTYVCLGEPDNAKLALTLLHQLVFFYGLGGTSYVAQHVLRLYPRHNTDDILGSHLTALLDLLHNPWFERVWVVQEVVVSRNVTVLYGKYEIIWDYLMVFMEILSKPEMAEIFTAFQYSGQDFVLRPLPISPIQAINLQQFKIAFRKGQKFELWYILRTFYPYKATEPKDKIFALLELTEEAPHILSLVDYDKKTSDLFYEISNRILTEGNLLEILQFAGIGWGHGDPNMPSWVVNWGASPNHTTLANSCEDPDLQHKAATHLSPRCAPGTNERHLISPGQIIDRVEILSSVMAVPDTSRNTLPWEGFDDTFSWIKEVKELVNLHCSDTYINGQPLEEAFWRTQMGDTSRTDRPAEDRYGEVFNRLLKLDKAKGFYDPKAGSLEKMTEAMKQSGDFEEYFGSQDDLRGFLRDVANVSWLAGQPSFPRSLCITKNGYIGMVPEKTNVGDVIVVLNGAQVPFALRLALPEMSGWVEGSYQLVGECYVHGMMDGEAFELGIKSEIFTII